MDSFHRWLAHLVVAVFLVAGGDAAADGVSSGEALYGRCLACHAVERNRTGPRHCGLNGRLAGSVSGYRYSEAMRKSGVVWNEETLNAFLAAPTDYIVGTTMGYDGIKDSGERRILVDWLLNLAPCS